MLAREEACSLVIGVVEDVRESFIAEPSAVQYYVPFANQPVSASRFAVLVRTDRDPAPMITAVRRALNDAAPDLSLGSLRTMKAVMEPRLRPWRLGSTMFTVLGLLALAVAFVGFYNTVAYGVVQRRREMGIRSALGARRLQLISLIVVRPVLTAAAGVAIGLFIALLLGKRIVPYLYEVSPTDPIVIATASAVLLIAAVAASLVPALRAARLEPNSVLRAE